MAFFVHSKIVDGGLGIPSLRWKASQERYTWLLSLKEYTYLVRPVVNAYLGMGLILSKAQSIDKFCNRRLYSKFGGIKLKDSSKMRSQHVWIGDVMNFLKGRDYVNCIKARIINGLPTRTGASRGPNVTGFATPGIVVWKR